MRDIFCVVCGLGFVDESTTVAVPFPFVVRVTFLVLVWLQSARPGRILRDVRRHCRISIETGSREVLPDAPPKLVDRNNAPCKKSIPMHAQRVRVCACHLKRRPSDDDCEWGTTKIVLMMEIRKRNTHGEISSRDSRQRHIITITLTKEQHPRPQARQPSEYIRYKNILRKLHPIRHVYGGGWRQTNSST